MHDPKKARDMAEQLVGAGFSLSIDDFGTGYSSLAQLKHFPIDRLKIDQSFVRDMSDDPASRTIVKTIIGMAKALHLRTVAEGVETRAQSDDLLHLGCDEAQGYYVARPMSAQEFTARWLSRAA